MSAAGFRKRDLAEGAACLGHERLSLHTPRTYPGATSTVTFIVSFPAPL